MRFYAIKIDGAPSSFPAVPGSPVSGAQFSTVADVGYGMQNDPGALRCLIRIEMVSAHVATANSFVRLYGIDINMLKQASNLNGLSIQIYAGFWPGLPLATEEAPYAGAIYCGTIYQAFGNWQDEDMTLDMLLTAGSDSSSSSGNDQGTPNLGGGVSQGQQRLMARQRRVGTLRPTPGRRRHATQPLDGDGGGGGLGGIGGDLSSALSTLASSFGSGAGWGAMPANLIHNWQQGQKLSDSIRQTLTKAFPWCSIDVGIADLLKNPGAQDSGFYGSLEQFIGFARQTSLSLMSGTQGAVGTVSGLVGAMAQGSGNSGLQSLASALSSAAGSGAPGSDSYQGIHSFTRCQRIIITDYNPVSGIQVGPTLKFEELIGQPTWLKANVITFRVPMRADIYPPLTVTLPPNTLEFVAPSLEQVPGAIKTLDINFANQPVNLTQVTAIGDSRHPDGSSWSLQCVGTVVNAAYLASQGLMGPDQGTPNLGGGVSSSATPQRLRMRRVQRY